MSLISGVPVSAISSGRAMRARIRSESARTCWERWERLVLDEVRLVDDHAAEPEVAEPADVPVQELVVHDHDVREPVHPVAVAVDHGGPAERRPQPDLVRPVRLHHVGHDDQQRVGVGRLGGEQRLGGLAEPGLVGEQERAVAAGRRRDDLGLVRHQLPAARETDTGRASGSGMQAGAPVAARSKDRTAARAAPSRPAGGPAWRSARPRPRSPERGTGSPAGAR